MGLTRIRAEQISDIDYKQSVRVIALENATLTGGAPAVVDGVNLVTGDRILVAAQDNAAQNGLYQVQTVGAGSNGTWIRTLDANQDGEIQPGMTVMVTQGTEYADTPWKLVTNGVIEIGVTELTFEENYSLAFGNVFANGTAVIATAVSDGIVFAAGENVSITGNNTTKTVTISATGGGGGGGSAIINGASNVNIATANADITMGVNGTANVVVVSSDGITVQGNVVGNGIATTTVSSSPPENPEQGDIWIDSDSAIQLIFFNDGNSSQWAEMEALVSISAGSGTVDLSAVDQDIIPSANATYSLGNATNRWANLFLVGNTIDLGGAQIKADAASGAIALIPAATIAVPNPSALVISTTGGINVVTTDGGNISGNAIANAAATSSPVAGAVIINKTVIAANTVVNSGENAQSVGPISIVDGGSVTVSTAQRWLIYN